MARRGRPGKSGKRTASGRLKVPHDPQIIQPSEQAKARRDLYGADGWDAIGRAYATGLLGEGEQAKSRLDMGRKVASLYRRTYARGYRCALNQEPRGSANAPESPFALENEQWLAETMDLVFAMGVRPFFEQLVTNEYPDAGPYWLDNLIGEVLANRERKAKLPLDERDCVVLRAALKGLDAIIPKSSARGIVAITTMAA